MYRDNLQSLYNYLLIADFRYVINFILRSVYQSRTVLESCWVIGSCLVVLVLVTILYCCSWLTKNASITFSFLQYFFNPQSIFSELKKS